MRKYRKLLLNRKLIIVITVSWLASAGYVVHQRISAQRDHGREQLLPEGAGKGASANTWPAMAMGQELGNGMLDSDSLIGALNRASSHREDYFDVQVNATEMQRLVGLMRQVDQLCKQHGLVYFMYAGTLMGSHRHHGMIPWDDDIDIMMSITERNRLLYLLRTRFPDLRIYTWSYHWKIWSASAVVHVINKNYGWPFVDVFFYAENETHIYDIDPYYSANYVFEKDIVFPLHYRPFMGEWLPAPKDTAKFLVRTVRDPEGCHSPYYLHKIEGSPKKAVSTRCELLKDRFPFVLRSLPQPEGSSGEGVIETLYTDNTPLHSVLVPEPSTSITFNYSLRLINSDGVKYAEKYS